MIEILGISVSNLTIGILTSLPLLYWFLTKNYNHWKNLGINGPKPTVLFGNFLDRCRNPTHLLDIEYVKKFGYIFGVFNGTDASLLVAEPELIKQILVKDFNVFTNRRELRTEHPIINKNLFNSWGEDWKRLRVIMSPTFTSGKMKKMYYLVRQCLEDYLTNLKNLAIEGKPIDAKLLHQNFTMDVIASCAFATKTNALKDPNNKFVVNGRQVLDFSVLKMIPAFVFPKWLNKLLKIRTQLNEEPNEFLFGLARHILDNRRKGEKNNDFLQLLIDANASDIVNNNKSESNLSNQDKDEIAAEKKTFDVEFANQSLNEDEIIAQAWVFLIAGFETTATTLGFISYELALNPDVQEKLYEEVINSFDANGEINYETLHSLPYLDAVVCETLRLYPPLSRVEREAGQDYKLADTGVTIKKGQLVEIPVYAIHRSEKYYKNADKFNPDRFIGDNRKHIIPYTYMPFGTGPRNCIGMRFAQMEVKLCIAHMIKLFRFTRCPETENPIQYMNLTPLMTAKSITLGIELR